VALESLSAEQRYFVFMLPFPSVTIQ